MPGGRPEKKINASDVRHLAMRGLTIEQIARCLGIAPSTLYLQKSKYSELSEAVEQGQARGIQKMANVIFEKGEQGDTDAAKFYLKCRGNWNERVELTGEGGGAIQHVVSAKVLSADEWEKQYGEQENE